MKGKLFNRHRKIILIFGRRINKEFILQKHRYNYLKINLVMQHE